MDKQFTLKLQEWLNTPAEERDLELGATLLLQLTNNKILYRNIKSNLKAHADFIEFKLKRYLQYRLQDLTHEEVSAMQLKVDNIAKEHALDSEPKPSKTQAQEFRAGKRADHDTLPAEIQALYVENASLIQKMRELHLQLRNLSTQASTCPDSDRYPFLKEIIELDKRYHQNWKAYDSYTATSDAAGTGSGETAPTSATQAGQTLDETARLEQKNILRQINLAKGRYKKALERESRESNTYSAERIGASTNVKNPSEKLKDSILSLYQQLTAPSDALSADLKQLGIL